MKYIIDNKEYDTDTAVLLCHWKDNYGMDGLVGFFSGPNNHYIYATKKKNLFHVVECLGETHAEIMDTETAQKVFDDHCEAIDIEAYKTVFDVKEG